MNIKGSFKFTNCKYGVETGPWVYKDVVSSLHRIRIANIEISPAVMNVCCFSVLHIFCTEILITYSTEQSPSWKSNWFSDTQEIPRILWIPKVHYRIHKCPTPLPIPGQIDPVHKSTSHLQEIHLNIILPSSPRSSKWFFLSKFLTKTLYTLLHSPKRATRHSFFYLCSLKFIELLCSFLEISYW
jgi:hypothetical protein